MNSSFLDALSAKNSGRPPIWLMRQAGRYMPSYQALKARYGSDLLFRDSELITTITLLPVQELGVDAAIVFSDILMVLETLGFSWKLVDGVGPIIENPFSSLTDLRKKEISSSNSSLAAAIKNLKSTLKIPLIGFAGGPFTLACYLIEGKQPGGLKKTKAWLKNDPDSFKKLLSLLSDAIAEWLSLQIEAGIDAIQIFDTLAGELTKEEGLNFSLPYLKFLLNKLPAKTPCLLYTKNSIALAPLLASLPCHGLSVDNSCTMAQFRRQIPLPKALQGNLDLSLLLQSKEVIAKQVKELLFSMRGDPAFIVNGATGLTPDIPYENVRYMVEIVKNYESL